MRSQFIRISFDGEQAACRACFQASACRCRPQSSNRQSALVDPYVLYFTEHNVRPRLISLNQSPSEASKSQLGRLFPLFECPLGPPRRPKRQAFARSADGRRLAALAPSIGVLTCKRVSLCTRQAGPRAAPTFPRSQSTRCGARLPVARRRSDAVRYLMLRHAQAPATQMAQTVVCNRHHATGRFSRPVG